MVPPHESSRSGVFTKTQWGFILWYEVARQREHERFLSEFWRLYRAPIFKILCSRGFNARDAEDVTQSFLLSFIQSGAIGRADPAKGRFRDFLVGALNHCLSDLQARAQTLKRGSAAVILSLDERPLAEAEALLPHEPAPQALCDRVWAATLLRGALKELEMRYAREGRARLFRLLKPHLTGDEPPPYRWLALRLRRSPATLRSDVKRLKEQFRELLREELERRVGTECADQEWEALREIWRGKN